MRPTSLRYRPPREQIPIGADLTTADDTGRPKVARTDEICRTREAVLADRVGQDTAADISAYVDAGPIIDGRRWKRLGIVGGARHGQIGRLRRRHWRRREADCQKAYCRR